MDITKGGDGGDCFSNNPRREEIRSKYKEDTANGKKDCFIKSPWTEQRKKKVSLAMSGRKPTEITRQKMSHASKKQKGKPKFILRGRKRTIEQKQNISKAVLNFWKNNPQRKILISGENNVSKRKEVREKISKTKKERKNVIL